MDNKSSMKSLSDSYLYQKYPKYQERMLDALMKDPIIDKTTDIFKDVIHDVERMKIISDPLSRILTSTNVLLLNCVNPLPRSLKIFASRDPRSKDPGIKIFIDVTNVITKNEKTGRYNIDDVKLLSYLMDAAVTMIYHKSATTLLKRSDLVQLATSAFAKMFTYIIDYLVKVSIQESNKIKTVYLSAMYFLEGVLSMNNPSGSAAVAKKIAGISDRESTMLEILIDKACNPRGGKSFNPYDSIKTFVTTLVNVLHLNDKIITTDIVVEKWLTQYGPGTVFGLEYFPAFSNALTDAYNGGYLNNQKTIEKVCGQEMLDYSKKIIDIIGSVV